MKLTKRVVDAIKYEGDGTSRDVRWDDEVPGFGVRIYPTGRKAFVLSYRTNGRKRLITLKDKRVLTVEEARKRARKFVAHLDEVDPLEARQRLAQGETIKELCKAYMDRYAKPHKRSWKDDERRINNRILPLWGSFKVVNIKHADIATLHSKIGKTHRYEANRMVELISKMFVLANRWGFVPDDHPNPAHNIEHFKEVKRDRWVTPDELPLIAESIDKEENIYARNALWLYLLTGTRKSELLKARWDNIDWERKELIIPETKAGRCHYLPLSEPALAILRAMPRIDGNPYILPGNQAKKHIINIDKPWQRVRSRATIKLWSQLDNVKLHALIKSLSMDLKRQPTSKEIRQAADFALPKGIDDIRLHDLRRTVGSWMAQAGNSLHLIGKVLNHSNQATTAIYARFAQDQLREALEQHSARVLGVAKKEVGADIINFKN